MLFRSESADDTYRCDEVNHTVNTRKLAGDLRSKDTQLNLQNLQLVQALSEIQALSRENERRAIMTQQANAQNLKRAEECAAARSNADALYRYYLATCTASTNEKYILTHEIQSLTSQLAYAVQPPPQPLRMASECSICCSRTPDACLGCGHVFCEQCVLDTQRSTPVGERSKCPQCRADMRVVTADGARHIKLFM